MGLGICVVGLGLLIGLSYNNLKAELAYLVAGFLLFSAGRLLERRKP